MLTPTGVTASAYTDAIMAGNPVHVRLTNVTDNIVFNDGDIELNGGLKITSYMNGEVDLTMGKAVMDELQVALFRSNKTQDLSWNSEFKLEMGVEISGTTNWVTVGYYIGKRPERYVQDDVINLQAVDRMSLFEKPAQDYLSTLTVDTDHPLTIAALFQGICTYCGVAYETGDEISATMSRSYTAIPFGGDNGLTCRDVIALIAEANCCYARINSAGNMVLTWYHEHMDDYMVYRSHEFDIKVNELDLITNNALKKTWADLEFFKWEDLESYLWGELEGQESPFRIHALNVRLMEEDSGIFIPSAADRGIYMIVDNPFLKTADSTEETTYLYPIYNRLVAFGQYIPMHLECVGNWLIEPGDVISVEVGRGNQSRLPIFTRSLKWNGACVDQYEATGNLVRETINPYVNKKLIEGGRMHIMRQTVDESYEMIQNELTNTYSTKQQTADAIELYVMNNCYMTQTGISITQAGVTIEGDQYVMVASTTDPDNYWVFDKNGIIRSESLFAINAFTTSSDIDSYYTGVFQLNNSSSRHLCVLLASSEAGGTTQMEKLYWDVMNKDSSKRGVLYADDDYAYFGTENRHWKKMFGYIMYGEDVNNTGEFYIFPSTNEDAGLQFEHTANSTWVSVLPNPSYNDANWVRIGSSTNPIAEIYATYGNLNASSIDVKHDINVLGSYGDIIDRLTPVSFAYDNDPLNRKRFGLVYEDTVDILPEICTTWSEEKAICYTELIAVLLKEIKDLRQRVAQLEQ